jgi:hypothetical protein
MMLTTPRQRTFLVSVAVAVIAVIGRVLAYMGIATSIFPAEGFALLLVGYLVLLAGNLIEGL